MCLCCRRLRGVDDQRAFFKRYAGQASGNDVDFVTKQNVGPQIDVARLKMITDQDMGHARNRAWLGDVIARIGLNLSGELFRAGERWRQADEHTYPPLSRLP